MNRRTGKSLDDVLRKAIDLTNNQTAYVNHVRFAVGATEVTIDLYTIDTTPQDPNQIPQAQRVYRFSMPIVTASEMGINLVEEIQDVRLQNKIASDDKVWDEIEALFGTWANRDDLDENWLDHLRGEWDSRLDKDYGVNGE